MNKLLNIVIDEVIDEIKENKNQFEELKKIDKKYNNIDIELQKVIRYIENYRNKEIQKKNQKIIFMYRGNPYITIDLCMQAIINNCKIVLITEQVMYGINLIITRIFQKVLKNSKIEELIIFKDNIENKKIVEISSKVDKSIVIGDVTRFQALRKKVQKIEFHPYNNIAIFIDDEKFEKIAEKLCEYAEETEDDIEIYRKNIEDIEKDKFIEKVLILSEDKEIIEYAKEKLKGKKVIINKNPLEKLENINYMNLLS